MSNKTYYKNLIAAAKLKQAITELLAATEANGQAELHNNLIALSGRYNQAEKDKRCDLIVDADYRTLLAQMNVALLAFLEEYEEVGLFTPFLTNKLFCPVTGNSCSKINVLTETQHELTYTCSRRDEQTIKIVKSAFNEPITPEKILIVRCILRDYFENEQEAPLIDTYFLEEGYKTYPYPKTSEERAAHLLMYFYKKRNDNFLKELNNTEDNDICGVSAERFIDILESLKSKGLITYPTLKLFDRNNTFLVDARITEQGVENVENLSNQTQNKMTTKPRVFISYSHADNKSTAQRIKARLEQEGIAVTLDLNDLGLGNDIKAFIEYSIRENDITLSIVSRKSLASAWIGMETINTFYAEKYANKKFIAAFTDGDFFDRSFVRTTTEKLDTEIADIKSEIDACLTKNIGIAHLQNELQRYTDLRNNLPTIVQRLKESLAADISEDNFENGLQQITDAISKVKITTTDDAPKSGGLNIGQQNADKIYNIGNIDTFNA